MNSTSSWFLCGNEICDDETTASCSSVKGCSGSVMDRRRSVAGRMVIASRWRVGYIGSTVGCGRAESRRASVQVEVGEDDSERESRVRSDED